jgi:hypothetical protein
VNHSARSKRENELVADDLNDDERRALHAALSASWKSAAAGRLRSASAILEELRQRCAGERAGPNHT